MIALRRSCSYICRSKQERPTQFMLNHILSNRLTLSIILTFFARKIVQIVKWFWLAHIVIDNQSCRIWSHFFYISIGFQWIRRNFIALAKIVMVCRQQLNWIWLNCSRDFTSKKCNIFLLFAIFWCWTNEIINISYQIYIFLILNFSAIMAALDKFDFLFSHAKSLKIWWKWIS